MKPLLVKDGMALLQEQPQLWLLKQGIMATPKAIEKCFFRAKPFPGNRGFNCHSLYSASTLLTYYSFVGMTGGQIFHEMMKFHGVEHICKFATAA